MDILLPLFFGYTFESTMQKIFTGTVLSEGGIKKMKNPCLIDSIV